MKYILDIILLEFRLAFRNGGQWLSHLVMFVLMVALVPFGVGVNQAVLQEVAVGFVWIGLLLSTALSLPNIFQKDWEYGMLDQFMLGGELAEFTAAGKLLSYWLISGVPLAIISPILVSMLFLPFGQTIWVVPGILLGGICCSAIGSLAAALMIGSRRAGTALMVLVLPLFIPVLIFGSIASNKALSAEPWSSEFMLLLGFSLLLPPISIWAQGRLLKKACE